MTIKTIIVDDERLARKELTKLLQEFPEFEIIDEAENAFEAKELIDKKNPDLIFLDVQMPQKTGFDLLSEIEHIPLVIFTTAYDNFAIKAFELNAFDYLLKPIEPQRLAASLASVKLEFQKISQLKSEQHHYQLNEQDQVFVKDGERCWFVKLSEIRVFESVGNYSKVYFGNVTPLILKSLNYLEERINPKLFFRVNRKYMINLKMIKKIETNFNIGLLVEMDDGFKVEISRRQTVKFKELMSL